jgi:hypothetical protein
MTNNIQRFAELPWYIRSLAILPFLPMLAFIIAGCTLLVPSSVANKVPVLKSCRRFIKKKKTQYVELSKQGPFYRAGAFVTTWTMRTVFGTSLDKPPSRPEKLKVTQLTTDSIKLRWVPVVSSNFGIDTHTLEYKSASDKEWQGVIEKTTETEHECTDLIPGQTYHFRVQTINTKGGSEFREIRVIAKQLPVDNGGVGPGYSWSQTSAQVEVTVPIRGDISSKEIKFEVKQKTGALLLEDRKTGATIVEGVLCGEIKHGETYWELSSDGQPEGCKAVLITLPKKKNLSTNVWAAVIEGAFWCGCDHPFPRTCFVSMQLTSSA